MTRRVRQIWEQNWLARHHSEECRTDPWTQIDLAREIESDLNKVRALAVLVRHPNV